MEILFKKSKGNRPVIHLFDYEMELATGQDVFYDLEIAAWGARVI